MLALIYKICNCGSSANGIKLALRRWDGDNRACVGVCFLSKPSAYLHSSEGEEVTPHDPRRGRAKVRGFSYTPRCMRYYDMIVDDTRQFAGVVLMTGSAVFDGYDAVAQSPMPLARAPSVGGARLNTR